MTRNVAGDRLGEWVLDELLGEGAFGQVWRAHAGTDASRRAAVKVPRDERGAALLRAEGALAARLDSPRIARLLGASHDPPYAAFELVSGRSLRDLIGARGRLPAREVATIARGILLALQDAHAASIAHRDLKPDNVLVSDGAAGASSAVKVTLVDLGLAVPVELEHSLAGDDAILPAAGTLPYLPPEVRGGGAQDARGDLYAWGVVLFEMLTGSLPAAAEVPSQAVADLSPTWDDLYRRACAARERRYTCARDALIDLEAAAATLPRPAPKARARVDVRALLEQAASDERALLAREFMAYVTPEGKASARCKGKTYTFDVPGRPGLCMLRATSPSVAVVVSRFGEG